VDARVGLLRPQDGAFVATAWGKTIFSPIVWVRFPHMLLASYLTGTFCVAATGARVLRGKFQAWARIMLRVGFYRAVVRRSMRKLGAGRRG